MIKDKTMNMPEPDPREAMLPWYVAGTLDAKDRAAVEAYLEENPQTKMQLELVGEEIDAVLASGDAVDPPSAQMLDRLMADIDMREGPERASLLTRAIGGLTSWMPAAAPTGLRVAGIAAVLAICLQAAAIGWLTIGQQAPGAGYQTASGPAQTVATGPSALVAFQDSATAADIARVLDKADATIVEGPRNGGIFVIRFKSANMTDRDTAAAVAALNAQGDTVKFAAQTR